MVDNGPGQRVLCSQAPMSPSFRVFGVLSSQGPRFPGVYRPLMNMVYNGPGQRVLCSQAPVFPSFSVLCSQGCQNFQSPTFPGLRVRGSLEAGIVDWEQRYSPNAMSGDLRAHPCADMAEKCLYYSLLAPRRIFTIRCITDKVFMK